MTGIVQIYKMQRRVYCLECFKEFLCAVRTKINFTSMELSEILKDNKDELSRRILLGFNQNNISESFSIACKEFFQNEDDKKMAEAFLTELGRTDARDQIINIEMYLESTGLKITEARAAAKSKSKVNLMFFTFLSITVVMILL